VRRVLIAGIGNVLLGDDGIGPYAVHVLDSQYEFDDDVEVVDLGTPSLDLTHRIMGLEALILVDAVASDDPPGTVVQLGKADLMSQSCEQRVDPHSPALTECLQAAAMLGGAPEQVLFIGIAASSYDGGAAIQNAVLQSVPQAIKVLLDELDRLGVQCAPKPNPDAPKIWWLPPAPSPIPMCREAADSTAGVDEAGDQ
jgi:hydrogenase maturation protease